MSDVNDKVVLLQAKIFQDSLSDFWNRELLNRVNELNTQMGLPEFTRKTLKDSPPYRYYDPIISKIIKTAYPLEKSDEAHDASVRASIATLFPNTFSNTAMQDSPVGKALYTFLSQREKRVAAGYLYEAAGGSRKEFDDYTYRDSARGTYPEKQNTGRAQQRS